MRPFVRFGRFSRRWYVDRGRRSYGTFPGTAWIGYGTLVEAMNAARAAYVPEPA